MIRKLLAMVSVTVIIPAAVAAGSLPNSQGATSFSWLEGARRPVWFLCDATNAREILVVDPPRAGRVTIARYAIPGLRRMGRARYTLGRPDPGAGNIYFALGQRGRDVGNLRAINSGMIDPPPKLPSFSSITVGNFHTDCRMTPGALLLGLTPRRTVTVSQEGGQLIYRAYSLEEADRRKPSIVLSGGRIDQGQYMFRNGRFTYRVGAARAGAGGYVQTLRNGRVIATEQMRAYSVSANQPD